MIKKILINVHKINEIRVAFTENGKLNNFEIESEKSKQKRGNIYKGIITKIEPSLDAVFVNYGGSKDGFLPFKEISQKYLKKYLLECGLHSIKNDSYIKGQSIIIQVEKEEDKNKGATLTTYISLAGCYIVLIPDNLELEGISRRIDGKERRALKENLNDVLLPKNMGIIIRTLGLGKQSDELKWELNILLSHFKMIQVLAKKNIAPILIYEEVSLVTKIIKDYLKFDLSEIIIDDVKIFNLLYKYLTIIKSDFITKIKLYNEQISLFSKYEVESQIELIFKREIFLTSGGSIVIDQTEALTTIDINSSRFNKCDDIERTALQTNLEAINEVVKQIIIKDLSGLIIIDFIDMDLLESRRLVEKTIKNALLKDKAKIQIGKVSQFCLLEISRQKFKKNLDKNNKHICYKCFGMGKVESIESLSSIILRVLEEEIIKNNIYQVQLELPIKIANYIINIKRNNLLKLEKNNRVKIIIIVNKFISVPDYKIYKFANKNLRKYKIQNSSLNNSNKFLIEIDFMLQNIWKIFF